MPILDARKHTIHTTLAHLLAASLVGALPLVLAGGPGSASRSTIGIVVIFGVGFSTLLSLFVVPAFYALLAPYTHSPGALAQELRQLEDSTAPVGEHASMGRG